MDVQKSFCGRVVVDTLPLYECLCGVQDRREGGRVGKGNGERKENVSNCVIV